MKRFMGYTQEIRTSVVFNLLKEQFYCKTRDGKSALYLRSQGSADCTCA